MLAESCPRLIEVLIVAGPTAAANLAAELRARGVLTRIASTESEYLALDEARPAAALAVIDLGVGPLVRDREVQCRSRIAALSGLPTLLIGAGPDDLALFANVRRVLPVGVDADVLAAAIAECSP